MYSIGQVVRLTGMSQHTQRLYEDAGFFVNPVERHARGNRRYDADDVDWLQRLGVLRRAGMPVAEITAYAALVRRDAPDSERLAVLRRHRDRMAEELRHAHERLDVMERKIASYDARLASGRAGAPWPEPARRTPPGLGD